MEVLWRSEGCSMLDGREGRLERQVLMTEPMQSVGAVHVLGGCYFLKNDGQHRRLTT